MIGHAVVHLEAMDFGADEAARNEVIQLRRALAPLEQRASGTRRKGGGTSKRPRDKVDRIVRNASFGPRAANEAARTTRSATPLGILCMLQGVRGKTYTEAIASAQQVRTFRDTRQFSRPSNVPTSAFCVRGNENGWRSTRQTTARLLHPAWTPA